MATKKGNKVTEPQFTPAERELLERKIEILEQQLADALKRLAEAEETIAREHSSPLRP